MVFNSMSCLANRCSPALAGTVTRSVALVVLESSSQTLSDSFFLFLVVCLSIS